MVFELKISSELENLKRVRTFLDDIFVVENIERQYFNKVLLCLSESVSNAILHGNKCISDKIVTVSISYSDSILKIYVQDEGSGFDFESIKNPTLNENLLKENGRGIFLVKNLADQMAFYDGGWRVEILYHINK